MIRRSAAWLPVSAMVTLVGCADVPQAPPEVPADIRVLDSCAFPGGEVRVRSAAFANAPPDSVFAGSVALASWSVADSTLTVRLPEELGAYQLHAKWLGQSVPLGTARVVGFQGAYLGPTVGGPGAVDWGSPSRPAVLVDGDSVLEVVDLQTGTTVESFPDSIHWSRCMWVPGPTYQPGVFIVSGKVSTQNGYDCGRHRAWRLWPTVAPVDSAPDTYVSYRGAAQTGPATWLRLDHHWITAFAADSNWQEQSWGSADALRISPRGDRVVVLGGGSVGNAAGLPVFDALTGRVAYRVDAIRRHGGGGAFSDEGDTLWVAGTDPAGWWRMFALESATGRILGVSDSLQWDSDDVAVDPLHPFLFVSGTYYRAGSTCAVPLVRILNRSALRAVGTLYAPPGTPCVWLGQPQRLVVDALRHRLYDVGADAHLVIYSYEIIP